MEINLRRVDPLEPVVGPVLTIYLLDRWVTCCMCGEDTDHSEPVDRRCVPIWNGEPTTSTETVVDGYKPVCARCYLRWDSWDDRMRSNGSGQPTQGHKENPDG